MGLIQNIRSKIFGTIAYTDSDDVQGFIQRLFTPGVTSPDELLTLYTGYPHAAITGIAEDIARTEFFIERVLRKSGDIQEDPTHPFIRLLNRPNDDDSKFSLIEKSDIDYSMFGEFFWFLARGEVTNLPVELHRLNPLCMTEIISQEDDPGIGLRKGQLAGWRYRTYQGVDEILSRNDVLNIHNHNPRNPHRGWGVMQAALTQIMTEKHGGEFTLNFLANNAFPGGIFSIKNDISKDNFDRFKSEIRQAYSGTGNAGKLMVLKGAEGSFSKMGANLEDLALKDLNEVTTKAILNMFKFPRQNMGDADSTLNRATAFVIDRNYAKRTIQPRLDRICSGMQKLIDEYSAMVNRGRTNKIDSRLTYRDVVPEDTQEKLQWIRAGLQDGFISTNEARQATPMQLPDIAGGDTVYHKGGLEPLGDPVATKKLGPKAKIKISKITKQLPAITLEQFEEYRKQKWDNLNDSGKEVDEILSNFWASQKRSVISRIKSKAIKEKAFEGILFSSKEEADRLKELISPTFENVAEDQFNIASKVGAEVMDKAYSAYVSQISGFIKSRLSLFVVGSMDYVRGKLEETLSDAASEGLTIAETATRIEEVYAAVTSTKSMMIARTELNAIANKSAVTAFKDQGFSYKQWFANPGACEFCRPLDGKIISIESDYVKLGETLEGDQGGMLRNTFMNIGAPPAHVNCKCDTIPANEVKTPFGTLPPLEQREELSDL